MNFVPATAPILRKVQPEYTGDPRDLRGKAEKMLELMKLGNDVEKDGLGLAAPQLGLPLRMFVMRSVSGKERFVCINPKVSSTKGKPKWKMEGCLTIPGKRYRVCRFEHVEAQWTDANGAAHRREFQGWDARCFQHELDHLDGKVVWDPTVTIPVLVDAREKLQAMGARGPFHCQHSELEFCPRCTEFVVKMVGDAQDGSE